jgi:hypothetical protein
MGLHGHDLIVPREDPQGDQGGQKGGKGQRLGKKRGDFIKEVLQDHVKRGLMDDDGIDPFEELHDEKDKEERG